jgi:starch synthase (maltosyl-transferring)
MTKSRISQQPGGMGHGARPGQETSVADVHRKAVSPGVVSESTEPMTQEAGQPNPVTADDDVTDGEETTQVHDSNKTNRGEPAVTVATATTDDVVSSVAKSTTNETTIDTARLDERIREASVLAQVMGTPVLVSPSRPTDTEPLSETEIPTDVGSAVDGTATEPVVVPVIGRIPVLDVSPRVNGGRWPVKAVVGERVPVSATVFGEGHDAVAATAVLVDPKGAVHQRVRMSLLTPGTDRYGASVTPDAEGRWIYRVEGWNDPYATWEHDATIKIGAGVDVELMLEEGARLFERAVDEGGRDDDESRILKDAVAALRDTGRPVEVRLSAGTSPEIKDILDRSPLRDLVTASDDHALLVQRERALYSSWYEMFPRSEGAHVDPETGRWVSGTFAAASRRLPAVAAMGFDIVYLPPIHPVGRINRKGPNNTLTPGADDPGSPWAIGSDAGGHDAVHPDLGTIDDFDEFVTAARAQGLEVALDLALQCAPDHPWAKEHPEWFTTRIDGTIAYAENPPKKYQDIYPINFDNDPEGLSAEVLRVVEHWISHGVTIFRVDNPHTKPVWFWEWLIGTVNQRHPEILFLAEAFTRPAMMHTLAKVGFHQSYTYFTWRTTKSELTEYLTELSGEAADYMRPNFWPTTPDILHEFLQYGGPAAFKIRAVLAATMSPSWGIYSGYELCEHISVKAGSEEYLDSEKYQYRPRDWAAYERGGPEAWRSIGEYVTKLNTVRRDHPALQRLRNIDFHRCEDDNLIVFSRRIPAELSADGQDDTIIVVVNLDPHGTHESTVQLTMPAIGLDWQDTFIVHDALSGETYRWGEHNYIRLDPHDQPAHVLHVRRL